MDLTIRDLVIVNQKAVLDRGVQLAWYNDPERNEYYATRYIFSHGHFRGDQHSAIQILEMVRESLLDSAQPNILTVIADYGHGKTHFGLVLANFFSRPIDSPIVNGIIEQIRRCSDDQTAEQFRYFKQNSQKPQLVVRLSGHTNPDLRQNFLSALRQSLDENEATKGYPIKSVCRNAAQWLGTLSDERRAQAEQFLADRNEVELSELTERLEGFETRYEALAYELSEHLFGIRADFGATSDLQQVITEAIDDLCVGSDAPFNKLVILFDELGVYLEEWLKDHVRAGNIALQSILEACRNRPGKACFVTFIQRDPDQYADYAQPDKQGVTRFTTRLTHKVQLVSNLEHVLNGLIQVRDPQHWTALMESHAHALDMVKNRVLECFPKHYEGSWSESEILEVICKGTFPLHPLTTALLCHLSFSQGRSVMQFVDEEIRRIQDQPAVKETGDPNWILPTRVVDFYGDNLHRHEGLAAGRSTYSNYEYAANRLGANADPDLYEVLKALLLYNIGEVRRFPSQPQAAVLGLLAGLSTQRVEDALQKLERDFYVIRYITAREEYEFSGVGTNAGTVREQVERAIAGRQLPSLAATLDGHEALKTLNDEGVLPDTSADQYIESYALRSAEWRLGWQFVDAASLLKDGLEAYQKRFVFSDMTRASARNRQTDCRGLILVVLPGSYEERQRELDASAEMLNNCKCKRYPVPVALALTRNAEDLHHHLLALDELSGWSSSRCEIFGQGYEDAQKLYTDELNDTLKELIQTADLLYADEFRRAFSGNDTSLTRRASIMFHTTYPCRPPADSDLMEPSKNNGRRYTATIGRYLLTTGLSEETVPSLEKPVQNLISAVLIESEDKWGILDTHYRIKATPAHPRVQEAWKLISETIRPDAEPLLLSRLVDDLYAPPYGYDDLTLTLLLCAWFGRHQHELSFIGDPNLKPKKRSLLVQRLQLEEVANNLTNACDFINWLRVAEIRVERTNIGRKRQEALRCAQEMLQVSDYDRAVHLLDRARTLLNELPPDMDPAQALAEGVEKLDEKITEAENYRQDLEAKKRRAKSSSDLADVLQIEQELSASIPPNELCRGFDVLTEAKDVSHRRAEQIIRRTIEQRLERIEQYERLRNDLERHQQLVVEHGLHQYASQIAEALEALDRKYHDLRRREQEEQIRRELSHIRIDQMTSLSALRQHARDVETTIEDLSEELTAVRNSAQEKISQIQGLIDGHLQWLDQLSQHITQQTPSLSALRTLRDEVRQMRLIFEGTPEHKTYEELAQKLESIYEESQRQAQAERKRQEAVRDLMVQAEAQLKAIQSTRSFSQTVPLYLALIGTRRPEALTLNPAEETRLNEIHERARSTLSERYRNLLDSPLPKDENGFRNYLNELAEANQAAQDPLHQDLLHQDPSDSVDDWPTHLQQHLEDVQQSYQQWQAAHVRKQQKNEVAQEFERFVRDAEYAQNWQNIERVLSETERIQQRAESVGLDCQARIDKLQTQLIERRKQMQDWLLRLSDHLQTLNDTESLDGLRAELLQREPQYAGHPDAPRVLQKAREDLAARSEFLRQLASFASNTGTVEAVQNMLQQIQEMPTPPRGLEPTLQQATRQLELRLEEMLYKQREALDAWLRQFQSLDASPTPDTARRLLRVMETQRPDGLSEQDEAFLRSVEQRLNEVLDQDLVQKIVAEFERLTTNSQKVECLHQLLMLCQHELTPDQLQQLESLLR